jgi:GT2 family glycosyltransferase
VKILGYIGTYNDAIGDTLEALLQQTHPVGDIIIVDNASTKDVLPRDLPEQVTVLRVPKNIGPNSAVATGLGYALDHGYDWMWLLESDGAPHPDALERLVELYESFDPDERSGIGVICSALILLPTSRVFEGRRATPGGMRLPRTHRERPYWECDQLLWNACLFNMKAVREVGLPRLGQAGYWDDLSQDYGDTEFTFRIRQAGYRLLVHRSSFVDQRVGRARSFRILGRQFITTNHAPDRRYLFFRNLTYFWIHIYPRRNWPRFLAWYLYRFAATSLAILLLEDDRRHKILALVRGALDGWRGNIHRCYPA